MTYIDGFIIPVPEDKVDDYRKLEEEAGKVWMKYGALSVHACIADDVPDGKVTDFKRSVKLEEGETVAFAWIVYKSREHRDEVNAKVMEDPYMKDFDMTDAPFDGKRMIYGGFREIVSL